MEEFGENLIDTELPAPAHSCRESDLEHPTKMATKSRKHSIHTHFPKDRNYDVCCEEHGYYEWASGQKLDLTKQGKKCLCKAENFVPIVVPGLSSNSGTSSSSASPPQDSSRASSSPAPERSDEPAPGNWRYSPKSQNKNKEEGNNQATKSRLRDLPEWLE